jgi:hypothetical protein
MSDTNWKHVQDNVQLKHSQLSIIGKSVIVNSQILPIIMFTGSVMAMPASMNKELSKGNLTASLSWVLDKWYIWYTTMSRMQTLNKSNLV